MKSRLPAATHIQVKLKRRHLKERGSEPASSIPLSELPLSLGSGPLWQLYRRNNGQDMAPKRPKEVSLEQLLRLIDEIHRCKAIMEDDRDGTQVPTIMEQFFFDHMQSTYGEESVVLRVVHGVFKAVERFRSVVPTVELFYRTLVATMDDSAWRYMQQCRALLSSELPDDGAESDGAEKLRSCIRTLYNDISEHELEVLVESYKAFISEFQEKYNSVVCPEPATPNGESGKTVGGALLDADKVFEFLTQSLIDGKEHRHNKIRKKLIAIDVLQKNTLKITQFQQFISGYTPRARKSLPTMLYRGAAATVKHHNPAAVEVKVNLSTLALVCAVVEMSLLC